MSEDFKKTTKRKHSEETKRKISEKRRMRDGVNPPRHAGQSKKRKSLYDELKNDYQKAIEKDPSIAKWLEDNKVELGHLEGEIFAEKIKEKNREFGIITEFTEMYSRINEYKIADVLYSEDDFDDRDVDTSKDPYMMIERLDSGLDIFGMDKE